MAIRISLSEIPTLEICEKILQETTVIENKKFVPGKRTQNVKRLEVQMFKNVDDKILLPFFYAKSIGFDHSEEQKENWLTVIDEKQKYTGVMRDYQTEILLECIELLFKHGSCIIGTPPGSGKTIMASKIWFEIGLLGVIITNRSEILKGWIKTFEKCCPNAIIWKTTDPFPKVMPHIIITMDGSVKKIPEELRLAVGTLIIDEVHMLCTETRKDIFLSFEPKYVIFESATLERENGLEKMATLVSGEHGVFRISKVPYNVYVLRTGIFGNQEYGNAGLIIAKLWQELARNPERQDIIIKFIKNNLHRKFIIIQRVTDGIDTLVQKLNENGVTADSLFGNKKNYKNSTVLIGVDKKMGTGFDEVNACKDFDENDKISDTVIISNSILSWQLFEQVRGRVMRSKDFHVVWLMDENPSSMTHFKGLKRWIKETNGTIIDIDSDFVIPKEEDEKE